MDLEAELGIDSIKRVEILSAVQEAVPALPELEVDHFGSLRTLGEVVEQLAALLPKAPTASAAAPIDLSVVLIQIVAEKTGYPSDVLDLHMDLEAELGIDSIKRVEILSAVQEALPHLPDLNEEALSSARTLADIHSILSASTPTSTPATGSVQVDTPSIAPAGGSLSDLDSLLRRETLVRIAPVGKVAALTGPVVITADSGEAAAELAEILGQRGIETHLLAIDWSDPSAFTTSLPEGCQGLIHMAAVNAESDIDARVQGALFLAQSAPNMTLFATVTGMGGTFGIEGLKGHAALAALGGLTKTLSQEWPNCRCLAIDVDPDDLDVARIADELLTDRGVIEVGLSSEVITIDSSEIPLHPDSEPITPVQPGDLIVVSGGARGVTAAVAAEATARWKPNFLLLGRSPLTSPEDQWAEGIADADLKASRIQILRNSDAPFSPASVDRDIASVLKRREMHRNIDTLKQQGIEVLYRAVDVRDGDGIRHAVAEAAASLGPVRGLIHGAGVIADKLVVDKTPEQVSLVYGTKVEGFRNLLSAVDLDELCMVGVFSSVAGRYGNRGQADYAMGNEAITHMAIQVAERSHISVKAFHWGPWAGGMVNPSLQAALEARGMSLIDITEGAQAFCDEFATGGPTVEVVIGGPSEAGSLLNPSSSLPANNTAHLPISGSRVHSVHPQLGYLEDHQIGGKAVLPFVMALEWMVDAAQHAYPGLHVSGVRDVAVLKGVVVDEPDLNLTLTWEPVTCSPNASAALEFKLLGKPGPLDRPTVHYRGVVDLSDKPPAGNRFPGSNGLGKAKYPYTVKEAYERFLFHGPGLQGIEDIVGMSDKGIVATLSTSRPVRLGVEANAWQTDPVALDSALQLVGLWVREKRGASALPCYLGEYRQFAPFRSRVTCHIEMEPSKSANGRFQATFVDPHGRVVASVNGGQYASRKALNDSFQVARKSI